MISLLEIQDLHIVRDRRSVLHIKNLAVESGQVLAVVGPNGAGGSIGAVAKGA